VLSILRTVIVVTARHGENVAWIEVCPTLDSRSTEKYVPELFRRYWHARTSSSYRICGIFRAMPRCRSILHVRSVQQHQANCNHEHSPSRSSQKKDREVQMSANPQNLAFFSHLLTFEPISSDSRTPRRQDRPVDELQVSVIQRLDALDESLRPPRPQSNFTGANDQLIGWTATRSISFRALECDLFHDFCLFLNPQFKMPSHKSLLSRVATLASSLNSIRHLRRAYFAH
jgi:hypothetical protein